MAKNNKGAKTAPQTKKAPKPAPQAPAQETVTNAEEVSAAEMKKKLANVKLGDLATGNKSTGLDANHQVELNGQIIDLFVKNPKARDKWGDQVIDAMTDIAAIGVMTAVADEVVNGNSTFALTVKNTVYAQLVEAGKNLGVELPVIENLLPGKVEGTVTLPGTEVTVSEESAQTLTEEKTIQEAGEKGEIELDPKKVAHMGEEDLKKALQCLMVTGAKSPHLTDTFTNAVDFMREYRMEIARQAQNSTEAMNKYDERSMKEWLLDIFNFVKPTFWVNGIGTGLYKAVEAYKSPIRAFLILRKALIDKKTGQPVWDDQSIADAVAAIVEMKANNYIAEEQKALNALDKNAKGYRDVATKHEEQIKKNEEIIGYLHDVSFDLLDKLTENEMVSVVEYCDAIKEDKAKVNLLDDIVKQYYPATSETKARFIGLNNNIKQSAGIILNLFRSADNQNSMYAPSNIIDVEEMEIKDAKEMYRSGKVNDQDITVCYRYMFADVKKKDDKEESKKDQPLSRLSVKFSSIHEETSD